ncbi:MAG TPA: AAA family ATPase [Chloroflexia bacterium]|nr:AAA family ATPase [Chloroflexia bacterium]
MIIFVNGPFGVGKTTVANGLTRALPGSMLYDPELIGFVLHRLPGRQPADFQDLARWRSLTVRMARLLRATRRDLIIPMTIWRPAYFAEVVGGLRAVDPAFHHFCLTAAPATIYDRLRHRGDPPGTFAWQHVAPCLAAFATPAFASHVPTDGRAPAAIVADILAAVGAVGRDP